MASIANHLDAKAHFGTFAAHRAQWASENTLCRDVFTKAYSRKENIRDAPPRP